MGFFLGFIALGLAALSLINSVQEADAQKAAQLKNRLQRS